MGNTKTEVRGIGFFGLLGVVFITLKLTGNIDWSWWWVTIPLWGGAAISFIFFVLIIFIIWLTQR